VIALLYLGLMLAFGDAVGRRFYPQCTFLQRLATAFIVGLLGSTWMTYLASLAFSAAEQPLLPGDGVALAVMTTVAFNDLRRAIIRWRKGDRSLGPPAAVIGSARSMRWDWILVLGLGALVTWMMTSTLGFSAGQLRMGVHEWGDLGPGVDIAQSFALGHNFPTEYPLFAGQPILYHFLYQFQVGNLTLLGLDPATANNVLSISSIVALLILVRVIGERLFRSVLVGRIGMALFFVHGSLSFVPFLGSFPTAGAAMAGVLSLDHYLSSVFPYHGEDWAVWSLNVYLNQRHLASAIGIVLLVVLFLLDRQLDRETTTASPSEEGHTQAPVRGRPAERARTEIAALLARARTDFRGGALPGYVFCGILLGLLPFWNSALYLASAVALAAWFLLFPNRLLMLVMAATAAVLSVPQLLLLRADSLSAAQFPQFHWGYVVTDPTLPNVLAYVAFIFGPKLALAAVAMWFGTSVQRRVFLVASTLFALAFLVQLTPDIVASHKFLNAWLILVNLFAAYGLVRLWQGRPAILGRQPARIATRLAAGGLAALIMIGGVIDLFPIKNDPPLAWRLDGDAVFDWVRRETEPADIFLSNLDIVDPILLAGRRIYYGWPVYAWSAGYDTTSRDSDYRQMLQERSPRDLLRELQQNHIAYVAIDDGLRHGTYVAQLNETVFRDTFEAVFSAPDHANLVIYRIPTDPSAADGLPGAPPLQPGDRFSASMGSGPGQLDGPRGLAVEPGGTILIADTGNDRIERFAADGSFIAAFGARGDAPGNFNEPYSVTVDARGHVFVADTWNHRIEEFDEHDQLVAQWNGPDAGFYGPRDVVVGPDGSLYVVDGGRARVVRRAPDGAISTYGSLGAGDGQLDDPTAAAVVGSEVFVADPTNHRIVIFGTGGEFHRSLPVPEWGSALEYPDLLAGPDGRTLLASSPATNEVLEFNVDGTRLGALTGGSSPVVGPGAMGFRGKDQLVVLESGAGRVSVLQFDPLGTQSR
jgi:hypothetical protein